MTPRNQKLVAIIWCIGMLVAAYYVVKLFLVYIAQKN